MATHHKFARRARKLRWIATVFGAGILTSNINCNMVVRDAVTAGISQFITEATRDMLTLFLRPLDALLEYQAGTGGGGSSGGGNDPFQPPPAQS